MKKILFTLACVALGSSVESMQVGLPSKQELATRLKDNNFEQLDTMTHLSETLGGQEKDSLAVEGIIDDALNTYAKRVNNLNTWRTMVKNKETLVGLILKDFPAAIQANKEHNVNRFRDLQLQ